MPAFELPSTVRYISFDCYGTLTNFRVGPTTAKLLADRVPAERMAAFLDDFTGYRLDEVLGAWKPYRQVLGDALRRACSRWAIDYRPADGEALYAAVPGWGPHADVPAGLARLASRLPLVILSNAADEQIQRNVDLLGAPFHAVLTAEQAQAYKPRYRAFEHMFEALGAGPEAFLHVSSSLRYDLMVAHDLRIGARVYVERNHGPANPAYGYTPVGSIGGIADLLGIPA